MHPVQILFHWRACALFLAPCLGVSWSSFVERIPIGILASPYTPVPSYSRLYTHPSRLMQTGALNCLRKSLQQSQIMSIEWTGYGSKGKATEPSLNQTALLEVISPTEVTVDTTALCIHQRFNHKHDPEPGIIIPLRKSLHAQWDATYTRLGDIYTSAWLRQFLSECDLVAIDAFIAIAFQSTFVPILRELCMH
jgi:hypothetical protein